MCPEIFLAFLYFLILILVNVFLWKLLSAYVKNIFFIDKIKKVAKNRRQGTEISLYFLLLKQEKKIRNISLNTKEGAFLLQNRIFNETNDILILGNSYKYLKRGKKINNFFERLFSLQFINNTFLREKKEEL